jgi:hypothetical protein
MKHFVPIEAQQPEPRTLFYPIDSDGEALGNPAFWGSLFVPALLLLAIFAPLIILSIPLCWIACKLNGVPFTWNIPVLFDKIDSLCDSQTTTSKR